MPLGPNFPLDPYAVIDPADRWYPGATELDETTANRLIPPLVGEIRKGVHAWRLAGYPGISQTSRDLLTHWFLTPHVMTNSSGEQYEFNYYFAQREAVETAIWLFEHEQARDPYNLIRYDSSGAVSTGMFRANWARYVFKLATGAGKTKVLSLLVAWSYFHKLYEDESTLSRNILLVAPNIIVLDRLRDDFGDLRIFSSDPVLPDNGFGGRNWQDDFQMTLHIQDEVGAVSSGGNLFLTNVHRIYEGSQGPSETDENLTDYFLGSKPVTKTTERVVDLKKVVRQLNDLVVMNDEAHHIHNEDLAWFRSIQDIDALLRQRTGHGLGGHFDVTATPKHDDGAIFVETVCSYPLVEAIRQGVVKTPVVPDGPSRAKLTVQELADNVYDRYADHIKLGYLEWSKRRADLEKAGKKPILFIMTTTTAECDDVKDYLERTYPDLNGKVLVIHSKANGEISETGSNSELEELRRQSREIDSWDSKYLCVVSVMMLREGWDVQNVISMVGLRPYTAKNNILPEQTLGRGLRRMFRGDTSLTEYVSVVGTDAFLDFVESVKLEGVELERVAMGDTSQPKKPLLIEVDSSNDQKDIEALDIALPRLSGRFVRISKDLNLLDVKAMARGDFAITQFSEEQQREIVFLDTDTDAVLWKTDLGQQVIPTPQAVLAFFATDILRRLRMVGGREILYGKLKSYIGNYLFDREVDLDDLNVLRNLSEFAPRKFLFDLFMDEINELTITDTGSAEVINEIKLSKTRPFVVKPQEYFEPKRSVFNRIVVDSHLEMRFAQFLDQATDVVSFAKNTQGVHFFIEYVNHNGDIRHYYPDFVVKVQQDDVYVVETKGLQDLDVLPKWLRMVQWCEDATQADSQGRNFYPVFLSGADFDELEKTAKSMRQIADSVKDRGPVGS